MLYINAIKETFLDFPNDEDQAVIVFFEGCSHNCEDCQNKELQIRKDNHSMSLDSAYDLIIDKCSRVKTNKIVFSGGDPFYASYKYNDDLLDMINLISSLEYNNYEVCVYTGFTYEAVKDIYSKFGLEELPFTIDINYKSTLKLRYYMPSYLKCGKYNKHLLNPDMGKSDDSFILASSNQNFYKKVEKDSYDYKCISSDGILRFR